MCTNVDPRLPNNVFLLYQELRKVFMQCKDYYPLLLEKWSFDYREYYDSQIVIYGAGECGQALYQQMAKEGKCKKYYGYDESRA